MEAERLLRSQWSKDVLLNMTFSLQHHLDNIYSSSSRNFAFNACTLKDYLIWQKVFRAELNRLLGLENHPSVSLAVNQIQSVERGAYVEEKYALDIGEGVQAPIYLLVPKQDPPYNPMLVFMGMSPARNTALALILMRRLPVST